MLGRVLLSAGVGLALAVACGGQGFQGGADPAGGGDAGEPASAGAGAGGSDTGGSVMGGSGGSATAGMPTAGTEHEGGAGGVPAVVTPGIVIEQTSRIAIGGNIMDPSLTLSSRPAAGNALIVGISCFSEVENCVIPEGGVTDNQGNEYVLVREGATIDSSDTHGTRPYLFIAENIAEPVGDVTITVNPLGSPDANYQNFAWGVLEVSGLAENSVDQTGATPKQGEEPMTTVMTEGATTTPNQLAVAVHSARSNDVDFNYQVEPGWVERHVNADGTSVASQHSLATRIVEQPGVVSHTWTHNVPSRGVAAIIGTFRGAADP